jgi:PIN domain nuclease of toxin-antitoxin system
LDASALLALMYQEQGCLEVEQAIDEGAAISAVNLAEVAAKLNDAGMADAAIRAALDALDLEVYPLGRAQSYQVGLLRTQTKRAGLSLGDRACLALAAELGVPAITADRVWATLALPTTIRVLRES